MQLYFKVECEALLRFDNLWAAIFLADKVTICIFN